MTIHRGVEWHTLTWAAMAAMAAMVLCAAILIGKLAAGRSARRGHGSRAARWSVLGIACLALGLLAIAGWMRSRPGPARHGGLVTPVAPARGHWRPPLRGAAPKTTVGKIATVAALPAGESGAATPPDPSGAPGAAPATDSPATAADAPSVVEDGSATVETPANQSDASPNRGLLDGALPLELRAHVEIDYAARPAWVERADRDVGPIHQIAVSSGPYLQPRLARRELDVQVKRVIDDHICELVGSSRAARWLGYDAVSLRQRFIARDKIFDEQVLSPSFGRMYQSHALLELGPEFHQEVEQAWHEMLAQAQLVKVALGAVGVLSTLVLVATYFRADTATKGFYTRRLQFVTLVAILGLVASGILAARAIPWLWP